MPLAADQGVRRINQCPGCGYALDGLPDEGTCPECGFGYDQAAYILYGFGRGQHASFATANPRMALLQGAGLALLLLFVLSRMRWLHRLDLDDYIMYGAFLVIALLLVIQRFASSRPGLVQVWLTPVGCGQKDDLNINPMWGIASRCLPLALWLAVAVATIQRPAENVSFLVAVTIIVALAISMRFRSERLWPWQAPPPHAAPPLTSWDRIEQLTVTQETASKHRIRVTAPTRWTHRPPDPVDIEVACTVPEARRLTEETTAWIRASRASGGAQEAAGQ